MRIGDQTTSSKARTPSLRSAMMCRSAATALSAVLLSSAAWAEGAGRADDQHASTVAAVSSTAAAAVSQSQTDSSQIRETNRYFLSLTTQFFDGSRDFSHSQIASIARMRRGDESWSMLNLGNGAVVIEGRGKKTAASAFENRSGTEQAFRYDYGTKTLTGDSAVADFHNRFVRPLLDQGPALGRDAAWETGLAVASLGIPTITDGQLGIKLSRDYFVHEGRQMVLLRYEIPTFTYTSAGGSVVVHWAKGAALTDPGFGEVYWNAALHRAVASNSIESARPYRFTRSAVAVDANGKALFDLRDIPEAQEALAELTSDEATGVMAYADRSEVTDRSPIALAANLDAMALTLAENSANQTGALAKGSISGAQGAVVVSTTGSSGGGANQAGSSQEQSLSQTNAERLNEAFGEDLSGVRVNSGSGADSQLSNVGAQAVTSAGGVFSTGTGNSEFATEELVQASASPGSTSGGAREEAAAEASAAQSFESRLPLLEERFGRDLRDVESFAGDEANAAAEALGADAMTNPGNIFTNPQPPADNMNAEEISHALSQGGQTAQGGQGSSGASLADEVSPETLRLLQETTRGGGSSDPFANVRGGNADSDAQFGNQGDPPAEGSRAMQIAQGTSEFLETGAGVADKTATIGGTVAVPGLQKLQQDVAPFLDRLLNDGSKLANDVNRTNTNLQTALDQRNNAAAIMESLITSDLNLSPEQIWDVETDLWKAEQRVQDAMQESNVARQALAQFGQNGGRLQQYLSRLPTERVGQLIKAFGDSPYGKILEGVSFGLNTANTIKAGANVYTAATTDLSSGQLPLSGSYVTLDGQFNVFGDNSDAGPIAALGLDLLALLGNATAGNKAAFASDAIAKVTGSISDIYVSNKAWNDTIIDNQRRSEEVLANLKRLTSMMEEAEREKLEQLKATEYGLYTSEETNDGGVSDPNWQDPRFDPNTGRPTPGYWAYLKDKNPQALRNMGINPGAPVGGWADGSVGPNPANRPSGGDPRVVRNPTTGGGPSYPTAPQRTEGDSYEDLFAGIDKELEDLQIGQTTELTDEQLAAIFGPDPKTELDKYQSEKIARLEEERHRREQERLERMQNTSFSKIEPITFDPVKFDPVTFDPVKFDPVTWEPPVWEPPVWEPPVWVPPTFDAPDFSGFEWTDFADDDWDFGGHVPSFDFGNMSGKVETDLSRWQEWLATQNVRELERLALQAGYPNLASALADFQNLMRDASDTGWRQWALAPPSCTGYVGCGPQYLERWTAKQSRLALGDILNADREFFSSAGLSDVQIMGLFLSFIISDFGLEDGDIVNVVVTQFGQTLFNETITTTNAGTAFRIAVRRGVVSVVMTAVNTGDIPPNTAALVIEGVSEGEDEQNYSLDTGETAGLKVTVGGDAQ